MTSEKRQRTSAQRIVSSKIHLIIGEVVFMLVLVAGFGRFMQSRVDTLLNAAVEESVSQQIADMSVLAEEMFQRETAELRYAANFMANNPGADTERKLMEELGSTRPGIEVGLLFYDGSVHYGHELQRSHFKRLHGAFRGVDVIDYSPGNGLVFAVPVLRGDNVTAVIYRLISESLLPEMFGISEYRSNTRILISERNGQIIIPYRDYEEEDREFLTDPQIEGDFVKVRYKLHRHKAAAVYSEGPRGRYFLFGADLPHTNCSMIGYAPWEIMAGGVAGIQNLILGVGGMLLLLFALISLFLFVTQARSQENDELRRANRVAERANRAKSDFLANMSHEIRTPINSMLGMNEMILRECRDETIRGYAVNQARAGEALLTIVNDILDVSKIESGKMQLVAVNYSLRTLLLDVMDMIRARAEHKGLELKLNASAQLPDNLHGDMVRLRQILVNLLTNAVKYTRQGSVELEVRTGGVEDNRVTLIFAVKDTGIGIKESDQSKVFNDFTRFDLKINRDIEGSGLGLAICHKLVGLMQGTISLKSVYGQGSTFTVTLPQLHNDDSVVGDLSNQRRSSAELEEDHRPAFIAPKARVLVVDDNEMNLLVVTSLLKQNQVVPVTCGGGSECLQLLKEQPFDVVLLDHMMPVMDGIETLHHALELKLDPKPHFVALTANVIGNAKERYCEEGFEDYLGKPIDYRRLEQVLMAYLPEYTRLDYSENSAKDQNGPGEEGTAAAGEDSSVPVSGDLSPAAPGAGSAPSRAVPAADTETGYDPQLGLKYCGGMKEMYGKLAHMFCSMHEVKLRQIEEALASENWKEYTTYVHALKSSALAIGGCALSQAAKELELSGKQCYGAEGSKREQAAPLEFIRTHHPQLRELYAATVAQVKEYLDQESDSSAGQEQTQG
ncbi:MAG: response regulator [Succinivibrio sp.]|nr:response regulator [Succinivibrio sp.]